MFVDTKGLLAEGVAIAAIESLEKLDVFDLFYKLGNGVALSVGAEQFGDDEGHISFSDPEVAWKVVKEIAASGMADKLEWQAREAETAGWYDNSRLTWCSSEPSHAAAASPPPLALPSPRSSPQAASAPAAGQCKARPLRCLEICACTGRAPPPPRTPLAPVC